MHFQCQKQYFWVLLAILSISALAHAASFNHSYQKFTITDQLNTPISKNRLSSKASSLTSTQFNLDFSADIQQNPQAMNAFQTAANIWSSLLADPVTINIDLNYKPLSQGTLGTAYSTQLRGGYNVVRDLVSNNAGETNNSMEQQLLPNLPTSSQFGAYLPESFALNGMMSITQANYLALGGQRITSSDGSITFSSSYNWDFDPTDGITAGHYDFVGVAIHEIGHILGFISEVDYVDLVLDLDTTSEYIEPSVLDLFRFSTADLDSDFNFTNTPRNLVPGLSASMFFGDSSALMSTGSRTGDGYQASHFKDNLGIGIMDPTFASGQTGIITENDLMAFDLIGWQIIPEPATIFIFALGSLIIRQKK